MCNNIKIPFVFTKGIFNKKGYISKVEYFCATNYIICVTEKVNNKISMLFPFFITSH